MNGGNRGTAPQILNFGIKGLFILVPQPHKSEERNTGTDWIRGWVRLKASLDNVEKKKISGHNGGLTPVLQFYRPYLSHCCESTST
jgi:hypothetical protein